MLPDIQAPPRAPRGPYVVSLLAAVLALSALVVVVADGACRPEPVPVSAPSPAAPATTDVAGQVRP